MTETKKTTVATTGTKRDGTPTDVPLFLRKTYHMIDSCDASIACWSDDGETFVVKDPSKFESEIIPQFFKHSKFTSFVRQLNFYSFRKIKYVDTIRLDPKLEAETANFWRFRHEKFQRGKPHLLTEIKRMNGHKTTESARGKKSAAAASTGGENSTEMKQELDTLKKRIEEMNKNMSELTSMVQKVTLKPPEQPLASAAVKQEPVEDVLPGAKRKKMDVAVPDAACSAPPVASLPTDNAVVPMAVGSSCDTSDLIQPDEMLSSAALDFEEVLPMLPDDAVQLEGLANDVANEVADKVFNEFSADDALIDLCHHSDVAMEDTTATHLLPDPSEDYAMGLAPDAIEDPAPAEPMVEERKDRADPVLMDRLSEALAVLPKEMQEQIVERLIAAITTTDLFAPKQETETKQQPLQQAPKEEAAPALAPEVGMPLAAATLAALLSHYSAQVKKAKDDTKENAPRSQGQCKDNTSRSGVKTIPVIPVHA